MPVLVSLFVPVAMSFGSGPGIGQRAVAPIDAFITQHPQASRYEKVDVDLNGDGVKETVVYSSDPDQCGSGGCSLFVLKPDHGDFRVVMDASVARPPIRLLPTRSHGWNDIGVFVAGGGILPGHNVRLRFDGVRYPGNPTVPPADPVMRPRGRILFWS